MHLDRRVTNTSLGVSASYSGGSTTWTLPYSVATDGSEGVLAVIRQDTLEPLSVTRPAPNQVRASGNYTGTAVYIGISYSMKYTLSTLYPRDQYNRALRRGRTTVSYLDVLYRGEGMVVRVESPGRDEYTKELPEGAPEEGTVRVPIHMKNTKATITVESVGAKFLAVSGFDWEGHHHNRAERI